VKFAVFASGSGTNFQALLDASERGVLPNVAWSLLVCDQPAAKVLARAEAAQIPVWAHSPKEFADKVAYEQAISAELSRRGVERIVLAGYMRLVGPTLLERWEGKIINLHPSLLPAFQGKDGIGDALRYGVRITGCTVHFVDAGIDTGAIIAQQAVEVSPQETLESLSAKIRRAEHQLLPQTVRAWSEDEFSWNAGKVIWREKR
jgi:phosphoribosylglycinamide formyltransferase-1